ncbi:hypothetical protein NE237_015847 [Protea cynaroides]|uniref:Uncharacterized protein n=1 Tax=Protea cynaroides TaxID=273540 RepID=A0A9Q0KER9_9MAGN|nr:hypothetical protein NE237_015847 [Protea cynaroides]
MSVESSFALSPNLNEQLHQNASTQIIRKSANFHPSIWGDHFIKSVPSDMKYDGCLEQVEKLKEEVRSMLVGDVNESSKKLTLIDSVQRLGVAYHFEQEIEKALEKIHDAPDGFDDNDLYTMALRFRLLRQQGYNVPCDFNRFKGSDGNFKKDLINDVSGMLCLYEATHLRVHGEDILDEALEFTIIGLKSIVTDLKPFLATQVMHALEQPLYKNMPRLEARHYIYVYREGETKNESLLKLAILDYNLLQSIYQQELRELSIWWKDLEFASKLPFCRDRLVESYFWAVAMYYEPHYALARKFLTKLIKLLSIIDDTYDVYGTLEELLLFTDAIKRWDLHALDGLPEYMKPLYSTTLDVFIEAEEELRKEGQSYRVIYAKEVMKVMVGGYLNEAKWFSEGYIPTIDEYLETGLITGAGRVLTVSSLVGMRDVVTKEAFDWIMNEPQIVTATNLMGRLQNDMVSHKLEQSRGHVCSAVECYMKQYNVSEQEVNEEFNRRVVDAWKHINEAWMKPTAAPLPVLSRLLNYARLVDVSYKYKDAYTLSHEMWKETFTLMFVDPIRV